MNHDAVAMSLGESSLHLYFLVIPLVHQPAGSWAHWIFAVVISTNAQI
jgi:hypothetical protein